MIKKKKQKKKQKKIKGVKTTRRGILRNFDITGMREELFMTQEGLAMVMRVGSRTVANWESKRSHPSGMYLFVLEMIDNVLDKPALKRQLKSLVLERSNIDIMYFLVKHYRHTKKTPIR